jgi:hypothetical protein
MLIRCWGVPGLATIAWMANIEVEITADLVQDLLRDQHSDLADRPVTLGARGWDNQLWRLGDDLAIRLPWATDTADALLLKENTWLPVLAPRLPLPVPVPQRLGEPSRRFPRPWIVTTWVPGVPADLAPAISSSSAAGALAAFLTALHGPAPTGAPKGRSRGGALSEVAEGVAGSLTAAIELGLIPNPDEVQAIWHDAVAAPGWAGPPVWLHGPAIAAGGRSRQDHPLPLGRNPGRPSSRDRRDRLARPGRPGTANHPVGPRRRSGTRPPGHWSERAPRPGNGRHRSGCWPRWSRQFACRGRTAIR